VSFELAGSDAGGAPSIPVLPGQADAPIDADGDGLYEDVTGDGNTNAIDVAALLGDL